MKTHYHHLFRGENVTSSLSFTSGGGLHRRTTIAYWLRESTLECFRLNLSLHTWCKVIGSTRVRTQHCTFSRDRMVHSSHWSTTVQELISFCRPLSPPRPRTSLPSLNWHQQLTNHFSTPSATSSHSSPPRSTESRHLIKLVKVCTSQRDRAKMWGGGQNIQTFINFEKGQSYINFDVGIDFQISLRMWMVMPNGFAQQ